MKRPFGRVSVDTRREHWDLILDGEQILTHLPPKVAASGCLDLWEGWPAFLLRVGLKRWAVWCVRARTHQRLTYGPLGIVRSDEDRWRYRDPANLSLYDLDDRLRELLGRPPAQDGMSYRP